MFVLAHLMELDKLIYISLSHAQKHAYFKQYAIISIISLPTIKNAYRLIYNAIMINQKKDYTAIALFPLISQ